MFFFLQQPTCWPFFCVEFELVLSFCDVIITQLMNENEIKLFYASEISTIFGFQIDIRKLFKFIFKLMKQLFCVFSEIRENLFHKIQFAENFIFIQKSCTRE